MKDEYKSLLVIVVLILAILFIPFKADCHMVIEGDSLVFEVNDTGEVQQVGSLKLNTICEGYESLFNNLKDKFISRGSLSQIELYDIYNEGEGLVMYVDGDGNEFLNTEQRSRK